MKNSPYKKGIDQMIGEEKWLDDKITRRFVQARRNQKKPQKRANRLVPVLVMLFLLIGGFTYYQLFQPVMEEQASPQKEEYPHIEELAKIVGERTDSEKAAQVFRDYLIGLQEGDTELLQSVFFGNENSFSTLLEKYEQVDFQSLRIESIIAGRGEPGFTVKIVHRTDGQIGEYIHPIWLDMQDGVQVEIYENPAEEWPLFDPMTSPPKEVELTYWDLPFYEVVESGDHVIKERDILMTEKLPDQSTLKLVESGQGGIDIYLEKEGKVFRLGETYSHIEDIKILFESEYFGDLQWTLTVGGPSNWILVFWNETDSVYQVVTVEEVPLVNDLNNDGIYELFILGDKQLSILQYEDGRFNSAFVNEPFVNSYRFEEITTSLGVGESTISVKFENLEGISEYLYQFEGTDRLRLIEE